MKNKICIKCKIEKDEGEFYFRKDSNSYKNECKDCTKQFSKKQRKINKEQIAKNAKESYQQNKFIISKVRKVYYQENKENIKKNKKEFYQENKENIKKNKKEFYQKNKNKIISKAIFYRTENKEQILKNKKEYYLKNKEKIKKQKKEYQKERRKTDSIYRLKCNMSRYVNIGLKNQNASKNNRSFFKFMGFTSKQLMDHLMNHPKKEWWMHENNQGQYRLDKWDDNDPSTWVWNLGHIIPHSTFKYTSMDDPEFKKCWALDNLKPQSAKENVQLGNRYNKKENK